MDGCEHTPPSALKHRLASGLDENAETLISVTCEPPWKFGFMESKLNMLKTTRPKLMKQTCLREGSNSKISICNLANNSQVFGNKKVPSSTLLQVRPSFKIVMPQGDLTSSVCIDSDLDTMKPQRREDVMIISHNQSKPRQPTLGVPAIRLLESSPSRSQMLTRGKSKSLNSPGFHRLGLLAMRTNDSHNKTENTSVDPEQEDGDGRMIRKTSIQVAASQRSILRQSATKSASKARNKFASVKEFEEAKKTARGISFSEFPQFGSSKKVSFSKTNMLKLYSVGKKMTPLQPR